MGALEILVIKKTKSEVECQSLLGLGYVIIDITVYGYVLKLERSKKECFADIYIEKTCICQ